MTVQITAIEGRLVRCAPSLRWSDSTHDIDSLEYVFANVETDEGVTGTGWSYTLGYGGRSVLELLTGTLGPLLAGRQVADAPAELERMADWLHPVGQGGVSSLAVGALDTALWDLRGKAAQAPVYELAGGSRRNVPAYASGIDLHLSTRELEQRVGGYLDAGYTAVKIKIGLDDAVSDAERVGAVRRLVGPQVRVMVDANQRWNVAETVRRSRLLEEFDLFWLEEPLPADDIDGYAQARSRMQLPLASGETLFTVRQSVEQLRRNAVDIIQTDVARVGGLSPWLKVAHAAEAHGVPLAPHFLVEQSIQGLCATGSGLMAEYVYGGTFADLGFLREPVRPAGGYLAPPDGPGLGLVYDLDALDRHTVARGRASQSDTSLPARSAAATSSSASSSPMETQEVTS